MAKKNEVLEDFRHFLEEKERIERDGKNKKLYTAVVLFVVLVIAFIFFSLRSNIPLVPGLEVKKQKIVLSNISSDIVEIQKDLGLVKNTLNDNKNYSYSYLNTRMELIENKNENLYQTILKDPDTAVTPIVLKKEQENINEKIEDLKKQVDRTNTWLQGILGTLLTAGLIFLAKTLWNYLFPQKNSLN